MHADWILPQWATAAAVEPGRPWGPGGEAARPAMGQSPQPWGLGVVGITWARDTFKF